MTARQVRKKAAESWRRKGRTAHVMAAMKLNEAAAMKAA